MDKKKLNDLRDYYDNTDTSAEIADAEIDDEVVESPMVGITVRMPTATLQRVREQAATEGIKTTALIRRWVEERLQTQALALAGGLVVNLESRQSGIGSEAWGSLWTSALTFVSYPGAGASGFLFHEDCVHANKIPVRA